MGLHRILTVCLLMYGGLLCAQQPVFHHYGIEQGLPSLNVYQAIQDRKGFLWFCTDHGVSRYDGNHFETWSTEQGFSDYGAFHMYEDSKGRIWFITFSGPACYFEDGQMKPFKGGFEGDRDIRWVIEDDGGRLWFTTVHGLLVQHDGNKPLFSMQVTPKEFYHPLYHMVKDDRGRIYATTKAQVYIVDTTGKKTRIQTGNEFEFQEIYYINSSVILFTDNGLYRVLDDRVEKVDKADHQGLLFNLRLGRDRQGNFWSCTAKGVRMYTDSSFSVCRRLLFPDLKVSSVLQDSEGNYWFTTLGKGVFRTNNPDMVYYPVGPGMIPPEAKQVAAVKGNCLIFSDFDQEHLLLNKGVLSRFGRARAPQDYYSRLKKTVGDDLVVYMENFDIMQWSPGKKPRRFRGDKLFHDFHGNPDTAFWTLKRYGVCREKNGRLEVIVPFEDYKIDELFGSTCFLLDGADIWVGTKKSMHVFRNRKGKWEHHDEIFRANVRSIVKTAEGIWVGTLDQGIFLLRDYEINRQFTRAGGLSSNSCTVLTSDHHGCIWVGSPSGLSWVKPAGKGKWDISRFGYDNYLPSNSIYDISADGDSLYVLTSMGLVILDERHIHEAPLLHVHITGLSVAGRDTSVSGQYSFAYQTGQIRVNFSAPFFSSPNELRYRYRLANIDSAWSYTSTPYVIFNTLEPGHYLLEISACNGIAWNPVPASLDFIVMPPVWRRPWFIISAALLLAIVLFIIVQRRVNAVRHKEMLERKVVESELKSLRLQMNPHFIFNSLQAIQGYIVSSDSEQAASYLSRFSMLIRMILNYTRKGDILLQQEIDFLHLYIDMEQFRYGRQFNFDITVDTNLDPDNVFIPSMLIQPLVENAVNHGLRWRGPGGMLKISFTSLDEHMLEVRIEDNGIGRKKATEEKEKMKSNHEPVAVVYTAERLRNLGVKNALSFDDLHDSEGRASGTRVILKLPLKQDQWK